LARRKADPSADASGRNMPHPANRRDGPISFLFSKVQGGYVGISRVNGGRSSNFEGVRQGWEEFRSFVGAGRR
jgi:hypothetical protein